jgi:hypothetical protein
MGGGARSTAKHEEGVEGMNLKACSQLMTSKRLHCTLQTRPHVREDVLGRTTNYCQKEKKIKSGHGHQRGARHQDELVD